MLNQLKILFVGTLILLITAATGGIHVIQHYCSCESIQQESNICLVDDSSPQQSINDESCCSSEPAPVPEACCSQEETSKQNHSCNGNGDCCSSVITYLKTDQVNLIEDEYRSFKFSGFFSILMQEDIVSGMNDVKTSIITDDSSHPPPKFGKYLLFEIHQLKLAPSMC